MRHRTFLATYRLPAIAALAVLAAGSLPAGVAAADIPQPPSVTIGGDSVLVGSDLVDAAKKTACTPTGDKSDFDTWSGELRAQVNTSPLDPKVQYVWNTYDSEVEGSAMAWVPDTGCAKDLLVKTQITDTSAAPHCEPVVSSREFTSYGHDHWQVDGTDVLVVVNPNAFQLPVTYVGNDGSDSIDPTVNVREYVPTSSSPDKVAPYCVRSTSVVTVESNGYYENNLAKYVWFACEKDEYRVTMTANGPQIDYVETVPCSPAG
ncbi:MAG: hypothetical protein QOC82_151 [Frankiaceae bacterium]|nr:hypothetical protein [Frankiaceae bacterium]